MSYTYRNHNTGDVVELEEPSARLDRLENWQRIERLADSARDQDDDAGDGEDAALREASEALAAAKYPELKKLAAERELDTSGSADELRERILADVAAEAEASDDEPGEDPEGEDDDAGDGEDAS